MSSLLPFVVIGLTAGSMYALSALGLTLTYRTTGIFNFAHGAIGAGAAYLFYDLNERSGVAWPVAIAIVVLGIGVIGGVLLERLGSVLGRVSIATRIVATVGLMVAIQALIVVRYGTTSVVLQPFLPVHSYRIGGTQVTSDQLIVMGVALVAAVGLSLTLKYTWFGVSSRAVVDDPELLALTGASPARIRRWSWIIGTVFAALSGVLGAAVVGVLDPTLLSLLLINAFGAAALGGFRNLPVTFIGGLAIGVVASVATKDATSGGILAGLPAAIPVIVLFVALLVKPARFLVTRPMGRVRPPARAHVRSRPVELTGAVVVLAVLVLAPTILGQGRIIALTGTLVSAILFLSLGLLVRMSGQVSLCQFAFAAVGAAAFYKLAALGVPWPLAVLSAGLIAAPVGALVAIPAIRLSGLALALATFGFGIVLQQMFYTSNLMFTSQPSVSAPRPSFAQSDVAYYHVVLGIAVLCAALVVWTARSRLGRLLQGMGQSPLTLATHGTNINVTKVVVFCIAAFLAGVSGALLGPITGTINPLPFDPMQSLQLVVILVLVTTAGGGTVHYALMGAIGLTLIPSYITSSTTSNLLPLLEGVSVVAVAIVASRHIRRPAWLLHSRAGASRAAVLPTAADAGALSGAGVDHEQVPS